MSNITYPFIPVPKKVFCALCKINLSLSEMRIFNSIIFNTYSFDDKPRGDYRKMTLGFIGNMCGMRSNNVAKFLKRLINKNMVFIKKEKNYNLCRINEDVDSWKTSEEAQYVVDFPKKYVKEYPEFCKELKKYAIDTKKIPTADDLIKATSHYFEEYGDIISFTKIDMREIVLEITKEMGVN